MSKTVTEIGIGAALVGGSFLTGGITLAGAGALSSLLASSGAGFVLSGVGTLLAQRATGIATTSRNPIQPWQVVYGRCKVPGTIVYQEEVGSSNRTLLLIVAIAAHGIDAVEQVWFNNTQLIVNLNTQFSDQTNPDGFWRTISPTQAILNITSIERIGDLVIAKINNPTELTFAGQTLWIRDTVDSQGGNTLNGYFPVYQPSNDTLIWQSGGLAQGAGRANAGTLKTTWANFGNTATYAGYLGNQTNTSLGASGLILGNTTGYWTTNCLLLGRSYVAIKIESDSSIYSGLPEISFIVRGKNDIYDPRTGTYGYTTNAALCIADYLSNSTWGFNAQYGNEIPTAQLIAAANVCDTPVDLALGGTEPTYTCDGYFDVSVNRGEVLQNLLTSCAGRLTYSGGQFVIQPAAWYGATATVEGGDGSTGTNMLMSSEGLVVNSYNNPAAGGRQGYFPDSAGTSESQFLLTLGMLEAYAATGNSTALAIANLAMQPMLPVLYQGAATPPAVVDATHSFAPHWLFDVKQTFTSATIRYSDTFSFTNGQCVVPDSYGEVRYVFQAMTPGYTLIYTSPYSPPKTGTAYAIASYEYSATAGGTVVTLGGAGASFSGTLVVIYSCLSGPVIVPGENFEAFPDWRPLTAGETDAACDTFNWAYRTFTSAAGVIEDAAGDGMGYGTSPYGENYGDVATGTGIWGQCAQATLQQAAIAYNIDNQRQWIAPSAQLQPFSQSGSFTYCDLPTPPSITCDSSGNIVLFFPTTNNSGTVTQFGVAAINDTYAAGNYTIFSFEGNTQGSAFAVQLYIDTTDQQPYNAENRYVYTLTANGGQRYDVTLTNVNFTNSAGVSLPVGSAVYTCGVQIPGFGMPAGNSLTIYGVQTYPNIAVKYEGGAIPFTANFLGSPISTLIGWRGPVYSGYQSPWMIKQLGNETNVATNVQFLADAQAAWTSQSTTKDSGPFAPVFYYDKPDAVQYGPANTFGWVGPDGNTEWVGYQVRPLAELAELVLACNGSEAYYNQAVTVTNTFLAWLDANWPTATVTAGPPSIYPQTGAQVTYPEPHAVALIVRACIKMLQAGKSEPAYQSLINKAMSFWEAWYQSTGVMAGTFCTDATTTMDWYGFWHGEILRTLALLYTYASSTNQPTVSSQALTWIEGMISWANLNIVAVDANLGYGPSDMRGGIKWSPKLGRFNLYNGVKGTFIFEGNQFQQSDFPPYAQDQIHGYTNGTAAYDYDLNYEKDGERRWKDIQLPFTSSASMAQRIAKIELLRIRQQGRGTLSGMMSIYGSTPLDVIYYSYPPFAWTNKVLEISNVRLTTDKVTQGGQDVIALGTEIDIAETDPSVYAWSMSEELSPYGQSYNPALANLTNE
jgi:hypothetical protein